MRVLKRLFRMEQQTDEIPRRVTAISTLRHPREGSSSAAPHANTCQFQTLSILSLPGDILFLIFGLVDANDILTCQRVCRSWAVLLKDDIGSQYRVELAAGGMVDSPRNGLTLTERCEALREHRLRLQSSAFRSDGHLWSAPGSRVQVLVCDGTVFYAVYRNGGFEVDIRPPPSAMNTAVQQLSIIKPLGVQARIEAIDMSQDLLIVSEVTNTVTWAVKVHLLSFRTGKAHPGVMQSVIPVTSEGGRIFPVEIFRRYVVWQILHPGSSSRDVEVWDWHAGCLIWRRTFEPQVSYSFLSEMYLIVTAGRQEDLQIYHFCNSASGLSEAEPVIVLELPLGAFRCSVHHDDRSRVHSSSTPCAPFLLDPISAIIPVRMAIYSPMLSRALLLVPVATFLEHIRLGCATGSRPHRIYWHEWGPQGSLLLDMSGQEVTTLAPYGTRIAALLRDKRRKKATSARIVIFYLNHWVVRASQLNAPRKERRSALAPLKDISYFQFRKLRATVPHVAYWGPQISFPRDYQPTLLAIHREGFTVLHEYDPPYRENIGLGYHTYLHVREDV